MNETVMFKDSKGRFEFVSKKEFVEKYPDVLEGKADVKKLLTEYKMLHYLHNPNGPAIKSLRGDDAVEYLLNGVFLKGEEANKIKHNAEFNDKFLDVVNDSE